MADTSALKSVGPGSWALGYNSWAASRSRCSWRGLAAAEEDMGSAVQGRAGVGLLTRLELAEGERCRDRPVTGSTWNCMAKCRFTSVWDLRSRTSFLAQGVSRASFARNFLICIVSPPSEPRVRPAYGDRVFSSGPVGRLLAGSRSWIQYCICRSWRGDSDTSEESAFHPRQFRESDARSSCERLFREGGVWSVVLPPVAAFCLVTWMTGIVQLTYCALRDFRVRWVPRVGEALAQPSPASSQSSS
mmetsp:Transcript_66983/g.118930  ORF Transcript_66983/g.118930 Transcript_66983/m.118930 type:complete len:246 (+) Transcript_66983:168-905(+)